MNEARFRDLISGKTRGLAATCIRVGLWLLSLPYGIGVAVRNGAYQHGFKTVHRAGVPVVSLGNLTTGGTGKTPFAAHVARWFCARNVRVCFVSRGYKALEGKANDEALVLAQLCPGVPHRQQPDRVAAARFAVKEYKTELVILDDGFQHRRLHRDLDIVLIDALNPWGYGRLLPRGLLREPLSGLRRAEVVVITRVDQATADSLQEIRRRIAKYTNTTPVEVSFPPVRLINSAGEAAEIASLSEQPVAAFCGIGNPQGFRESLEKLGLTITAFREFSDHHSYPLPDIADLTEWAKKTGAAAMLVTQKDLVKLDGTQLGGVPLWAVEIGCRIERGKEELCRSLEGLLST